MNVVSVRRYDDEVSLAAETSDEEAKLEDDVVSDRSHRVLTHRNDVVRGKNEDTEISVVENIC